MKEIDLTKSYDLDYERLRAVFSHSLVKDGDCLLWGDVSFAHNPYTTINGKLYSVRELVWRTFVGEIGSEDRVKKAGCKNRRCVNPIHCRVKKTAVISL